jgi:large subunit ribosomal protein L3
MQGLIGKKVGMTQIYDPQGQRVPVTVIAAGACVVVQRKTKDTDGYDAVQLGFEDKRERLVNKPLAMHFKKANTTPKRVLREFHLDAGESVNVGDSVTVAIFDGVTYVDVTGMTKGKGFQGVIRRHRMKGNRGSHGAHSVRRIGAIGQRAKPGKVSRGHRMAGHMGHVQRTQQNLRVVGVRPEDNVLLVEGAVPGPTGGFLLVKKARKHAKQAEKK